MSRIGKRPIQVPAAVKVNLGGQAIAVEGPKGKLSWNIPPRMKVVLDQGIITVSRPTNAPQDRALHGLTRTLIDNMVKGVTEEFSKTLEIEGIGFRTELQGNTLRLFLGFSHPVDFPIPEGIKIETPKPTIVVVKGVDKALVGQAAANIRDYYPPEPYKGKGIRYTGEHIRRKQGKSAA